MFLKAITLKGFKSFADKTVLDVEPGITVIVGPNGSGKSNVVDAMGWVLGTHSTKRMRSGQMADVIFAGSPSRQALGRAMVEITIDNSEGRLGTDALGTAASAQQFSEVRVSREIFASGENVYRINGAEVRALDVQELLSDTGLGREMHTIVGQGQLDAILNAKPEDRRAYIEEAAGIAKHRRRRERAIKKLDQVDVHIDKLKSVLRELRRQLRPLERQAEAANKYAALQADLRDVQVRLAAHDLSQLVVRRDRSAEIDARAADQQAEVEGALNEARERVSQAESRISQDAPKLERAQADYYQLKSLLERLRGTADLIEAKRRHLIEYVEEPLAGRPPDELRAQADRIDLERAGRQEARDEARAAFEAAVARRREAEAARRAHEQEIAAEARRRAEQRERILRWEGEVSALRGSIASGDAETGRIAAQLQSLDGRIAEAEADVQKVQEEIQRLDAQEIDLTTSVEAAEGDLAIAQERVETLTRRQRELERERASQLARAEALRAALEDPASGTSALLEAGLPGVAGLLADHVRIPEDAAAALAIALGPLGEAVLVEDGARAGSAVAWLRDQRVGRAVVLAGRSGQSTPVHEAVQQQLASAGARPIADFIRPRDTAASERAVAALRSALGRTYMARSWDQAVRLQGEHPDLTFVTPEGDLAGPFGFAGGAVPERSTVLTAQAALDAEKRVTELDRDLEVVGGELDEAKGVLADARQVLDAATTRINESDARITGAAERLARVHKELVALNNQRGVVAAQHTELLEVIKRDRESLQSLLSRGPDVDEQADDAAEGPDEVAAELDARVEEAREAELETRIAVERIEEQLRHLESQAAELRREADTVETALAEAARRREARRRGIVRCGELAAFCEVAVEKLELSIEAAAAERERLSEQLRVHRDRVSKAREQVAELAEDFERIREQRHQADLGRVDVERDIKELQAKVRNEFGLSPDELDAEHPDASEYHRDELVEREDVLVRKLGLLGRVNPLALEEFKALEDRHAFLSSQLEDLRQSKRDLQEVIDAVDGKIREVFADAFEDVALNFEEIFGQVFPGGTGRLVLTDPDDMLATGIEVEARPPGKRVKRLSLLSGGERSLTVLAFVFAIFKARPSPFYVLDEVDAALDDVNLHRLVDVFESFRGTSQLIIVTHQRRTMEVADVMYGVTMGGDAVSKVLSERLTDRDLEQLTAGA